MAATVRTNNYLFFGRERVRDLATLRRATVSTGYSKRRDMGGQKKRCQPKRNIGDVNEGRMQGVADTSLQLLGV